MLIEKIVSGGQTGVDRGALEAAFEARLGELKTIQRGFATLQREVYAA